MKINKTSKDYRKLNDFIRNTMRKEKVSQKDMAYRLGIDQCGISKRLSGTTDWTMWEIINVFDILGVKFEYKEREEQ